MLRFVSFSLLFIFASLTTYVQAQDSNGASASPNTSPSPGPKDGSAPNATNPDQENPLATVYIQTVKPGVTNSIIQPVFKENSLVGFFNSCRTVDDDFQKLQNFSDCFRDSQFNDRLEFEATYKLTGGEVEEAFSNYPPTLRVVGASDFAVPVILEYKNHPEKSSATVVVEYHCDKQSNGIVSLMLRMQFSKANNSVVYILWTKKCSSGINTEIEFGYSVQDQTTNEIAFHPFKSDPGDDPLVVVPSDKSTELYAKLLDSGSQQRFLAPLVSSSDPGSVLVTVRGNHPKGGVLKGMEVNSFQVSYECRTAKGSSKVSVAVAIPPYDNLTASWEKGMFEAVVSSLALSIVLS